MKGGRARGGGLKDRLCQYDWTTAASLSQRKGASRQRPRQTSVARGKKSGATNICQALLHARCGVTAMRQWFARDASNRASIKFRRGTDVRLNMA